MPDIPHREERERELQAALLALMGGYRREAEAFIDTEPSESYYDRMASEVEQVAFTHLSRVGSEASARLTADTGAVKSQDTAAASIVLWAHDRAAEASRQFVQRTREMIGQILANAAAVPSDNATRATAATLAMTSVFGEGRAATIASTETTGAASAGEMATARQIERDYRVRVVAHWRVDSSSNVCRICSRLHDRPQQEWERVYPDGPPGHPNCRCFLWFRVVGAIGPSEN